MPEEDAKSHMSELTEDRTQKHFYAQFGQQEQSPMMTFSRRKQANNSTPRRLPSYIGVDGRRDVESILQLLLLGQVLEHDWKVVTMTTMWKNNDNGH